MRLARWLSTRGDELGVTAYMSGGTVRQSGASEVHSRGCEMRDQSNQLILTWLSPLLLAVVLGTTPPTARAQTWQELIAPVDSLAGRASPESTLAATLAVLHQAEAAFGPSDTSVAILWGRVAVQYEQLAEYSEATAAYERKHEIERARFGPQSPQVAATLYDLGFMCRFRGEFEKAAEIFARALDIRRAQAPPDSVELARVLYGISDVEFCRGHYHNAQRQCAIVLEIWIRTLGPRHVDVFKARLMMGKIDGALGRLEDAAIDFRKAVAGAVAALGEEHLYTGMAVTSLAGALQLIGDYAGSEACYRRALAIYDSTVGPQHPEYARARFSLGALHLQVGQYDNASADFRSAREIYESVFGLDYYELASVYEGEAFLDWVLGDFHRADSLFTISLRLMEKSFGPDHPDLMESLNNIACVALDRGDPPKAIQCQQRALQIAGKALPAGHPALSTHLAGLADANLERGQLSEAESLYVEALTLRSNALGSRHPSVAEADENLGAANLLSGDFEQALDYASKAAEIRAQHLRTFAMASPEYEALNYAQQSRDALGLLLTAFRRLETPSPAWEELVADHVIQNKGEVSDVIFARRRQAVVKMNTEGTQNWNTFQTAVHDLSEITVARTVSMETESLRRTVDSLQRVIDECDRRLAELALQDRYQTNVISPTAAGLAAIVPPRAALIEYVRSAPPSRLALHGMPPGYSAVILRRDRPPTVIPLGDANITDSLVRIYRQHLAAISESGRMPTMEDFQEYQSTTQKLYGRIWKPLQTQVSGDSLLIISPDASLSHIAFSALPDPAGSFLIERHAISYLSAGRDLARSATSATRGRGLLAMGDPDFDAPASARAGFGAGSSRPSLVQSGSVDTRSASSGCTAIRDLHVSRLRGTRREVEWSARRWRDRTMEPCDTLLGTAASEENFKLLAPARRVIHLATHGFFLQTACASGNPRVSRLQKFQPFAGENPLLRSGLLFAGSNRHYDLTDSSTVEDGILTAAEVASLDLSNTDLVLLSACESGVGTTTGLEGSHGLRRAFLLAGTRLVVSALWPISDQSTADLIAELHLSDTRDAAASLRNGQLKWIARLKSHGQPPHPYTWGAFIVEGTPSSTH